MTLSSLGVDGHGVSALWDAVREELGERSMGPVDDTDELDPTMTISAAATAMARLLSSECDSDGAEIESGRLGAKVQEPAPAVEDDDLGTRRSIHDLVVGFYRELVMDDLLAPVFEEVAEVDWSTHIPLLIDYWCRILLGHDGYQGALLAAHQHVHQREPLTAAHFDRWYTLWATAVDERWRGPYADKAKRHAAKIAGTLAHRLPSIAWTPPSIDSSVTSVP
jgi:hemoglobin